MKSIEMGKDALKYIGDTAKEISGIGAAQRRYQEEISTPRRSL